MVRPSSQSSLLSGTVLLQLLWLFSASRATASYGSYADFRLEHRTEKEESSASYAKREALFDARVAHVAAHNEKGLSWTLAVNRFADFTHDEMRAMLGYKRVGSRWSQTSGGGSSFLQTSGYELGSIDTSS